MLKLLIIFLFTGVTSFSLYLTPTPVNRRAVLEFFQFFILFWILVAGIFMTVPFAMDWHLPLQQGLGSSSALMLKGILIAAACLFAVIVTRIEAEGALTWMKAILLLLIGIPELSRVMDFLNSSVNGMLNYSNMPMKTLYFIIFPYLIILATNVAMVFLGGVWLVSNIYKEYRNA